MRHLRNITEADVTAARATDPDTMRDLVAACVDTVAMRRPDHSEDVLSLAVATVARIYRGNITEAAGVAVAMATADTIRAYALGDWDLTGDMTEAVNALDLTGDTRTTMAQWSPRPDAIADASPRDYVHTLSESVTGMRTLSDYWTRHDSDACPECSDGAGRRVTPRGIVAHMEGLAPTDSAYHRARRHAVHAMREAAPVLTALLATYAPRPAGRSRQGRAIAAKTPVTTAHTLPAGGTVAIPASEVTILSTVTPDPSPEVAARLQAIASEAWRVETRIMRATGRARWQAYRGTRHGEWTGVAGRYLADEYGYPAWLGYSDRPGTLPAMVGTLSALASEARDLTPSPVTVATVRTIPATVRTLPALAPVAMIGDRDLTPAESFAIAYPACRAMASHKGEDGAYGRCDCPATIRHEGEEYGVTSAPAPASQRTPSGMVRTFKAPVSPRKRAGSNTGPTIPARF